MSDTPQGGWWKAKDGKWYPPETHPDHSSISADEAPAGPPAAGWWQANDGNWYPPETHPDHGSGDTIDLTEPSAGDAPRATAGMFGGVTPLDLTPVESAPSTAPVARSSPNQEPPGSTSRLPLIIAGAVAAAAVLVAAGVLLFGGGDDPEPEVAAPTSVAPTTTEAPAPTEASPATTAAPTQVVEPPAPVSGTGSGIVEIGSVVDARFLALVTHDGSGAFSMSFVDAGGQVVQDPMALGATGPYLGVLPVNFAAGMPFSAVRVDGEGPWAVTFAMVESAPVAAGTPGSTYAGRGDQVVAFSASDDTEVAVECTTCAPPMTVVAWSGTGALGVPLVVSDGSVMVPAGTELLQVTARGGTTGAPDWTLTPA